MFYNQKMMTKIVIDYLNEIGCSLNQDLQDKIATCKTLQELKNQVDNEISVRFGIDIWQLSYEHYLTASNAGWINY